LESSPTLPDFFIKTWPPLLNFFEKVRQPCLTFFGTSGRALWMFRQETVCPGLCFFRKCSVTSPDFFEKVR
jgi:hypothetical protein